jgi:hypothetical protein
MDQSHTACDNLVLVPPANISITKVNMVYDMDTTEGAAS